jgi:hypothetical protein
MAISTWQFKDDRNKNGNIFKTNGYLTLDLENGLCVVNPNPECCPCNMNESDICSAEYNINFILTQFNSGNTENSYYIDGDEDKFTSSEITKTENFQSCNQEMLVMWFNSHNGNQGNSGYTKVLDSGNTNYFSIKNVDDCLKLVFNDTVDEEKGVKGEFLFNNGNTSLEEFSKQDYIDIGYPKIVINPLVECSSSSDDCYGKYASGQTYDGHKIKYRPTTSAITTPCLTNCADLVELYFPCYGDDDSNLTTKLIGGGAFSSNTRLSAITLNSVSAVTSGAFSGCTSLKFIDWAHCPCHKVSYVETIGDYAFANCGIETLIIPKSVSAISSYAFSGCASITTIAFKKINLSSLSVSTNAFSGCASITSVYFYSDIDTPRNGFPRNALPVNAKIYVPTGISDSTRADWKTWNNNINVREIPISEMPTSCYE